MNRIFAQFTIPLALALASPGLAGSALAAAAATPAFDIAEFALPNCAAGEIRFEEPRDINEVILHFPAAAPETLTLSYLHKSWPESRAEQVPLPDRSMAMGWFPIDDWFNATWKKAEINLEKIDGQTLRITFPALIKEFPERADYPVTFRRTLGLKVESDPAPALEKTEIYTTSTPTTSTLRVELDAGQPTSNTQLTLSGYNARIRRIQPEAGVTPDGPALKLATTGRRAFTVEVAHLRPAHPFCNDHGNLTFTLDRDAFTISLDALAKEGPIWFADQGVFITDASDHTTLADYQTRCAGQRTIARQVLDSREQSLGGALNGQPRPQPVAFHLACKRARQRFWLEPNGDLLLRSSNVKWVDGQDTPKFKNDGEGRFGFGLERWATLARYPDASQLAGYNLLLRSGNLELEQQSLATPLLQSVKEGELAGDAPIVAMLRFRFRNTGDAPAVAELPIGYTSAGNFSVNRRATGGHAGTYEDDNLVPNSQAEALSVAASPAEPALQLISGQWHDESVLRAAFTGGMTPRVAGARVVLSRELQPGESCEVLLKIPYIALDPATELPALAKLDFDACYREGKAFWQAELKKGAQVETPEPLLNLWHAAHVGHVQITDMAMPGQPDLIQTSVGTSTYGNFANESCMIVQDLDERGLHDEARRRLAVWLKYQGTKELKGNFTDHDGVFYGCGGYESGETYDQHHGWVLWSLARHYFASRDDAWLNANAAALIKGADWVFRQRRQTLAPLPHSRGWERGFLPAGSLEDVSDYFYWLSTNTMSWRGTEWAARALEAVHHPEAARIRAESDAYRADLIAGFEKARQFSPLVRLRDGRWAPHYPSRLYLRGRDTGWIREILEGSVYLLISGLYDPTSKQAGWILDDYQDNRYSDPIYSYPVNDPATTWFDLGGFSCQPNLLAGLMPYLDRDEPEVYLWMFFNAFAACYREEIGGMSEHPMPILGFSNSAGIKTSDQSNASKWLRYMFVYSSGETLYLGRAIPREWFATGHELATTGAGTPFGEVSVKYQPALAEGKITLTADLSLPRAPGKILARFRHPEKLPIKAVTVNGASYNKFDPQKGDVDLTGQRGKLVVEARY